MCRNHRSVHATSPRARHGRAADLSPAVKWRSSMPKNAALLSKHAIKSAEALARLSWESRLRACH